MLQFPTVSLNSFFLKDLEITYFYTDDSKTMYWFYGRSLMRHSMQQSCGPSRKLCKNGMDWNGPSKAHFRICNSWTKKSRLNKIGSQPPCFKDNSIFTYTYLHIQLTHQESSTGSSMYRFTASILCVLKKRTRKA